MSGTLDAAAGAITRRVVRLRIDLAYDGAPFVGFARQPGRRTVQGTLEEACSRLLGQRAATTCAGRTDRGVHALAQVVHLDVDLDEGRGAKALAEVLGGAVLAEDLRRRLDQMVGPEITLWRVQRVGPGFDARFSAIARGYRYRLADGLALAPLARFDRWHVDGPLALAPMRRGVRELIGEHDFASFCKRTGRTTVRRLDEVTVRRVAADEVHVRLAGPAFCHNQVRAIVGCLVEVGRGRWQPAELGQALRARDRTGLPRVAPAQGLTLERVSYGRRWGAAPPPAAPPPAVPRAHRQRSG